MKKAIYPGTFDPITKGHLDVLIRALNLFEEIIIAVAANSEKKPFFSQKERLRLIKENIKDFKNVTVMTFEGLTVELAQKVGAIVLIRGIRAISDFEFEFQMAQMNRQINNKIETIYLMPNHNYFFTSSTLIKSIAKFSPNKIKEFIPQNVLEAFEKKLYEFK